MRRLTPADAPALHEGYADAALMRWWSSGPHLSIAETRAYVEPHDATSNWRDWAITLGGDDRAVGTLGTITRRSGVAEIGYLLLRRHWGQGYATEAVSRLLDLLFREEGYRRVFADTDPENAPSVALLDRLGFQREGLLRAEWETHIGVRDSLIFGLLCEEWVARPAAAITPPRVPARGSSATGR